MALRVPFHKLAVQKKAGHICLLACPAAFYLERRADDVRQKLHGFSPSLDLSLAGRQSFFRKAVRCARSLLWELQNGSDSGKEMDLRWAELAMGYGISEMKPMESIDEEEVWATPSDAGWLIESARKGQAIVKVVPQPCCPDGAEIGFCFISCGCDVFLLPL